jgi:ABC-type lipoprotein release transport system permease subunit
MNTLLLAWKNVLRHKWTSLVLVLIFGVASFVLFWIFGFSNLVGNYLFSINYDSYGDVAFFTDFFDRQEVDTLLRPLELPKVVCEREVRVVIENPQKSDMAVLVEITPENLGRIEKYIRPVAGRLPERPDEIVISEFIQQGIYHVGDRMFVTASTHEKVLNTISYRVVGISKSSAGKSGLGTGYLITKESMDQLVDTNQKCNVLYAFLPPRRSEAQIDQVFGKIKTLLQSKGILVRDAWTITKKLDQLQSFATVASGVRFIFLGLIFPLIGAVVAAFVWMHAFRRRREIWTYLAMGMSNRRVTAMLVGENWLLALVGIGLGLGTGFATSSYAEAKNSWIQFSYTFVSPFRADNGWSDVTIISVFILASVVIWMMPPLRKIMRATPFAF